MRRPIYLHEQHLLVLGGCGGRTVGERGGRVGAASVVRAGALGGGGSLMSQIARSSSRGWIVLGVMLVLVTANHVKVGGESRRCRRGGGRGGGVMVGGVGGGVGGGRGQRHRLHEVGEDLGLHELAPQARGVGVGAGGRKGICNREYEKAIRQL